MPKKQFSLPNISTLAGSTLPNFLRIISQGKIAPKCYLKIFLTAMVVIISTPFHIWEFLVDYLRLKKVKMETPPLFILGHWRSGTTMLHNMLCSDPNAAYVTTYQSVFSNNLHSKIIFKTFMKINIPEKRPSDNIILDVDFPQEDEFALSNSYHNAYYNFFYFPDKYKIFYERSIRHRGISEKEEKQWYKKYDKILKKALLNSNGKRLVIKNPVNSARINFILKLYPDARFLYIYRNPISVFLSTRRFFRNLFPTLNLRDVETKFIYKMIFDVYNNLMEDYLKQRSLIPKGNLYELKYEDFEKDPVNKLQDIYENLLNKDFEKVRKHFSEYFNSIKDYQKNRYEITSVELETIKSQTEKFMRFYGYDIPEDLVVIENNR